MYGRVGYDDGYAAFECMMAIKVGQLQCIPMPCVCMTLDSEGEKDSELLVDLLQKAEDAREDAERYEWVGGAGRRRNRTGPGFEGFNVSKPQLRRRRRKRR